MKKLVFDNIIFYLQSVGGISTYWFELTKRILLNNNFEIHNVIPNINEQENIYYKKINSIWKNKITENLPPKIASLLYCKLKFDSKFIFHSSYNRISNTKNAVNVITVHDLIPELFFKGWRRKFQIYRRLYFLKKAAAIVCVSENTKKDLLIMYPFCHTLPIEVIYNGIAEDFYQINELKKTNKILFVGRRPLYKNFKFATEVLKKLPKYSLCIIGNQLNKNELLLLEGIKYELYTNISNIKLNELYNESHCLLYPSSYEGFGIPVVEAMKSGCPVIGLNKGAVAEIASNDSAILLDELNIDSFIIAIESLKTESTRFKQIQNGLENSKKYNWDISSEKLANFYLTLI